MYLRTKQFGQLTQKKLKKPQQRFDDYSQFARLSLPENETLAARATAWTSYFTMVYAGVIAFTPETAIAAVTSLKNLAS